MAKRRIPVLAELRFAERRSAFDGLGLAARFDLIHRTNLWGAATSASGLGSELQATATLRRDLSALLRRLDVRTLLDAPCGDFGWMAHTGLDGIRYLGADIVSALVAANTAAHGVTDRVEFLHLDLVTDPLPAADLLLYQDCLVHLSFANIHRAIANMKRSGIRWLLTTTFTDLDSNRDIADGDWRALNLRHAPFDFPKPAALINEDCLEAGGNYADKALGLWEIDRLPIFAAGIG